MTRHKQFTKDPDDIDWFYAVWCTKETGLNDGSAADTGRLQGATISTSSWVIEAGLTEDDSNTSGATYQGVTYAANTIAAVLLSGGTDQTRYTVTNRITTSDGRTLDHTFFVVVRDDIL